MNHFQVIRATHPWTRPFLALSHPIYISSALCRGEGWLMEQLCFRVEHSDCRGRVSGKASSVKSSVIAASYAASHAASYHVTKVTIFSAYSLWPKLTTGRDDWPLYGLARAAARPVPSVINTLHKCMKSKLDELLCIATAWNSLIHEWGEYWNATQNSDGPLKIYQIDGKFRLNCYDQAW
jgi:hypothetical protein